ncbi:MAG: TonB-dependent receptor [Nitrospinota bacterium]|nr:TonB-dependent receptor [Nitrospinota bacterium]
MSSNLREMKMKQVCIKLTFMWLIIFPVGLSAVATVRAEDPSSEEAALDLLKVFDEATEIATKSKLNADYVPGMVTVLHGKDLLARGMENVWQALALVPGFDLNMISPLKRVNVRGTGNNAGASNIKLMLNSVAINANIDGEAFPLLEYPVAQIERIEIIRGPGSALHGEYAYNGVINIVTRKTGGQVYGRVESFETYSGGAVYSLGNPTDDFNLSFNIAGLTSDGAKVRTGPDALFGTPLQPFSNAPGRTNEARDNVFSGFNLKYKDFSLKGQLLYFGMGSGFGSISVLQSPQEDNVQGRSTTLSLEARQGLDIVPDLKSEIYFGWWQGRLQWEPDNQIVPPNPLFPNGQFFAPASREVRFYGGSDFFWDGFEDHKLLMGWSLTWSRIAESSVATNFTPSTGVPLPATQTFRGSESWVTAGVERIHNSIKFQDEYEIHPQATLTLGLRYDHYDDVGDRLTPRIAGVYRLTDHHILKAQYAQAFRPPTFIEMFGQNNPVVNGNPNTKPAIIDTFEVGYIYRTEKTVFRTTLFYSILDDLIRNRAGQSANTGGEILYGVELEWEQAITSQVKFISNLSLVETEDRATNEDVETSASILANVGVNYLPIEDLMFNVQYRYVGHRHREAGDTREDLAGYNNVDFTANWFKPFGGQGWTLRGGVRNLFDEDIRYAAPANTYPADYPRPGISFWAQLSYEF